MASKILKIRLGSFGIFEEESSELISEILFRRDFAAKHAYTITVPKAASKWNLLSIYNIFKYTLPLTSGVLRAGNL